MKKHHSKGSVVKMGLLYALIILMGYLEACSSISEKAGAGLEHQERQRIKEDSLIASMDSLLSVKIDLPDLIDSTGFSDLYLAQWCDLANGTDGGVQPVIGFRKLTDKILEAIAHQKTSHLDLMLVIDRTESMADDIGNIKLGLDRILADLSEIDDVRLAIATYGDRLVDENDWFAYQDFGSELEKARLFIQDITLLNGGDHSESVYDGVYNAVVRDFWRVNTKHMVLLIGDAPSHIGKQTDHSLEEIIDLANSNDVVMNFYPMLLFPEVEDYGTTARMQSLAFIESIYPNPSVGAAVVQLSQTNDLKLEVFNAKGEQVRNVDVTSETMRLDLYDQEPGVYVVRVYDQKKNYDVQKIVIQR